jgi:hypothetical protein
MPMTGFSRALPWAVAGCLLMLAGCGGSSRGRHLAPVTGNVTRQGRPLPEGRIVFMPVEPGDSASGQIVAGVYRLGTYSPGDGATPGRYKVAITSWIREPDMESEGEPAIPKRYFDAAQSGLTAEVTDKPGEFNFELD